MPCPSQLPPGREKPCWDHWWVSLLGLPKQRATNGVTALDADSLSSPGSFSQPLPAKPEFNSLLPSPSNRCADWCPGRWGLPVLEFHTRSHKIYFSVCVQTSFTQQSAFEVLLLSVTQSFLAFFSVIPGTLFRCTAVSCICFPVRWLFRLFPAVIEKTRCEHLHPKLFMDAVFLSLG